MTWEEIGYADGMKVAVGSLSTHNYPTRDQHGEQEEADYIRGYHQALADHKAAEGDGRSAKPVVIEISGG